MYLKIRLLVPKTDQDIRTRKQVGIMEYLHWEEWECDSDSAEGVNQKAHRLACSLTKGPMRCSTVRLWKSEPKA
jgi:hypothetical protein